MVTTEERKQSVLTQQKPEAPVTWQDMRSLFNLEQAQAAVPAKTWRPVTGGILTIAAGYANILTGVAMLYSVALPTFTSFVGVSVTLGIALIILGIYSVVGGSLAVARRHFGWALAGSITASIFPSFLWVPGVLSLIWVGLSKNEFKPEIKK